jgi:hypothetical protein
MSEKQHYRDSNMLCSKCNGKTRKYSPSGNNFKSLFWYECVGCGLPMRECICAKQNMVFKPFQKMTETVKYTAFNHTGDYAKTADSMADAMVEIMEVRLENPTTIAIRQHTSHTNISWGNGSVLQCSIPEFLALKRLINSIEIIGADEVNEH